MRYIKLIVVITLCLTTLSSQAALNLELTQGMRGAMPIAISPFTGEEGLAATNQLSKVISNDLQNSGRFKLLKSSKKVALTIQGAVTQQGLGRYQVNFKLLNTLDKNNVLLSQRFDIQSKSLRHLAHHISDLIYKQLTGTRGVFNTRIAYILIQHQANGFKQYRLEVADADGFNPQNLVVSTQPIMSLAWSADGKQIAYVSFENTRAEIYTIEVSTGKRRLITRYPGINGAPAWSPDGKSLALVLSKSGAPKIYLYHFGSKRLQQITHGPSIDTEPSWAPDGKSFLFTSGRGGSPQVYQYTLAKHNIQRLTFVGTYNATASFTPDSKAFVFLHREAGMFNIAKQSLISGRPYVLTYSGNDQSPTVAPNGQMVLYATKLQGRGVLSLVSIDGKIRLRLPAPEGDVQEPAWGPFT